MDRCYLFAGKQSSLIATGVLVQGTASLERCAGSCSGDGVFSMLSVDVEIAAGGRRVASGGVVATHWSPAGTRLDMQC